jgi:hypothetical protein
MNFKETPEFEKDFKRLQKKYQTLPDDLDEFKKILRLFPTGTGRNFAVLNQTSTAKIVKARLFCRTLKGSTLRIIYAYHENTQEIELVFIELYFKGEQENEDLERIKDYLRLNP